MFDGVGQATLDATGVFRSSRSARARFRQHRPVAYQHAVAGPARAVRAAYRLAGSQQASIELGDYYRERPLIIDPVLAYSSTSAAAATTLSAPSPSMRTATST